MTQRSNARSEANDFNQRLGTVVRRLSGWKYRPVNPGDNLRKGGKFLRVDIVVYHDQATVNQRPGEAPGTKLFSLKKAEMTSEQIIQLHTHTFDKTGKQNQFRYFVPIEN